MVELQLEANNPEPGKPPLGTSIELDQSETDDNEREELERETGLHTGLEAGRPGSELTLTPEEIEQNKAAIKPICALISEAIVQITKVPEAAISDADQNIMAASWATIIKIKPQVVAEVPGLWMALGVTAAIVGSKLAVVMANKAGQKKAAAQKGANNEEGKPSNTASSVQPSV